MTVVVMIVSVIENLVVTIGKQYCDNYRQPRNYEEL